MFDASSGELEARPADPEHIEYGQERRNGLVEGIIAESEDDDLLDRYLAGKRVPYDQLVTDLEAAVARASFFPVIPAVPTSGLGVRELVEVLVRGIPGAGRAPRPARHPPDGRPREAVTADPDGPLVAEVIKTTSDPYVGRISLVRVFSGTLRASDEVHVSGHLATEREGRAPDHRRTATTSTSVRPASRSRRAAP